MNASSMVSAAALPHHCCGEDCLSCLVLLFWHRWMGSIAVQLLLMMPVLFSTRVAARAFVSPAKKVLLPQKEYLLSLHA